MNKIPKHIIEIGLVISISLNLIALMILSNYSAKFNNIEYRLSMLSSSINTINNKVSNTKTPAKEETQSDIMTPTELSNYLKISIDKVYKSIIENPTSKFPRMKIDGEVRFSKNAIDEYMIKEGSVLQ